MAVQTRLQKRKEEEKEYKKSLKTTCFFEETIKLVNKLIKAQNDKKEMTLRVELYSKTLHEFINIPENKEYFEDKECYNLITKYLNEWCDY